MEVTRTILNDSYVLDSRLTCTARSISLPLSPLHKSCEHVARSRSRRATPTLCATNVHNAGGGVHCPQSASSIDEHAVTGVGKYFKPLMACRTFSMGMYFATWYGPWSAWLSCTDWLYCRNITILHRPTSGGPSGGGWSSSLSGDRPSRDSAE